jgi:hypothetical protein
MSLFTRPEGVTMVPDTREGSSEDTTDLADKVLPAVVPLFA